MFYRSLATSLFLHQTSDFLCRHFLNRRRSRALSTQSLSASHIAQELSGRFTAHSFLRPGTFSKSHLLIGRFYPRGGGGGVLRISSDGDDRMGAKIKTPKTSLGLPIKPEKIPRPKINPQKIPCRISEP